MADLLDFNDIYENYIGVGNRKEKIWFFGLEYGGGLDDNNNVAENEEYFQKLKYGKDVFIKYLNDEFSDPIEKGFYQTLHYLLENMKGLNYNDAKNISVNNESKFFYSNLSFLKFPGEKSEHEGKFLEWYKNRFTTNLENRNDYLTSEILKTRFENHFKKSLTEPKIIFLFKKNYLEKYKILLGFTDSSFDEIEIDEPIYVAHQTKIEFFKCGMHTIINCPNRIFEKEQIQKIVDKVNKYL